MTRLEAAIRSPISFRREIRDDRIPLAQKPETVGIDFDGRLFVWHAFDEAEHDAFLGDRELGPSVVTVLKDRNDFAAASTELERFLSVLSFYYRQPAEAVAYGTSSGDEAWVLPVTRASRAHAGWMMSEPFEAMGVVREPKLLLGLGYFREGQNAGSPFYRFLAYWNCLDAVFGVTRNDSAARDRFLDAEVPRFRARWDDRFGFPAQPARHFRDESRNAIAHVLRDPGSREIDPDSGADRTRLSMSRSSCSGLR